jgi:class 3 adenylate cyclase
MEIRVRIGLGAGEPLADGDALFGATVNLAARICASADPGQILAARVIRELCSGKSFTFRHHGDVNLKGFPDLFELHEVDWVG